MDQETKKLKEKQKEIMSSINVVKGEIGSLNDEIKRLEGRKIDLLQRVAGAKKDLVAVEARVQEEKDSAIAFKKIKLDELREESAGILKRIDALVIEEKGLVDETHQARLGHAEAKSEYFSVEKEIGSRYQKLRNMETEGSKLQAVIVALKEKKLSLEKGISSLKAEEEDKESLQKEIANLRGNRDILVQEIDNLAGEKEDDKKVLASCLIKTKTVKTQVRAEIVKIQEERIKVQKELDGKIRERINAGRLIEDAKALIDEAKRIYKKGGIPFPL